MQSGRHERRGQRVSKAWRWPLGGLVAAGVGALFVSIGGALWGQLFVAVGAFVVLAW